jgi:hypothetical protein
MATENDPEIDPKTSLSGESLGEPEKPKIEGESANRQSLDPVPAAPPAGHVVKHGTKTERELALERDLKAVQTRNAELEDINRTLRETPQPPARPDPAPQKKSWLDGMLEDL